MQKNTCDPIYVSETHPLQFIQYQHELAYDGGSKHL